MNVKRIPLAVAGVTCAALLVSSCASVTDPDVFPNRPTPWTHSVGGVGASTPRPQPADEGPDEIRLGAASTLAELLAYAAEHSPALEAAFHRWIAADERVPQAGSLPDPRLTYRYFIREVETRVGPQRQALGISQKFPWFGTLSLREDVASEAAKAARARYEHEKLRLSYRVKHAWYELYYLARSVEVTAENLRLIKRLESVARVSFKAGIGSHANVVRAQVELGKLHDRSRALLALRPSLAARLNAALGRATGAELPDPKIAPETPPRATDEEILGWIATASPQLAALGHKIELERRRIELARKRFYPDVTVGAEYVDVGPAVMAGVPDSGRDVVAATISINLPIWRQRNSAAVREAMANHIVATKARQDRADRLTADAHMVLFRLRDAHRKIDLYRDTLVPKAVESLKSTETAFRAGRATFGEIIDTQRVLLEFQLVHHRSLANAAGRLAELEMLVGRPIPRIGGKNLTTEDTESTKTERIKKPRMNTDKHR